MAQQSETSKRHVAIIGGGASGVAACRHLAAYPDKFTFKCFEQCSDIGGSFHHISDANEYECLTQPTSLAGQRAFSMYKNLRCNLPAQQMAYPDYPIKRKHIVSDPAREISDEELPWLFVKGVDMAAYIHDYVEHFKLAPFIHLNEQVTLVRLLKTVAPVPIEKYTVSTINMNTGEEKSAIFDAIIVCNGHYAKPKWPAISSIDKYQGRYMHCKFYRGPEQFKECKKILLYGACVTGPDIALNIAERAQNEVGHAYELILAGHNEALANRPNKSFRGESKVKIVADIAEIIGPKAVRYVDGTVEENVDAIIVNTGFEYYLPFLWPDDGLALTYKNHRLQPLYKHTVHIEHPTGMFFIALHHFGIGWTFMDMQARYIVALLKGDFKLPSREKMLEEEEHDFMDCQKPPLNWPPRYAHKMYKRAESYNDQFVQESGIKSLHGVVDFELYDRICTHILASPEIFKDLDYKNRVDETLGIKL